MCGIAGAIDFNQNQDRGLDEIYRMRDSLERRGPDQNGIYRDRFASLAHTRLSVIDVQNGIQPMPSCSEYGNYWLTYNGELYNTEELRGILRGKGYRFRSHSDTEVILNAYIEWGVHCVEHFNGIFAFAIWDSDSKNLFFARDRIGVKPFFYCRQYKTFLFGSELKALLSRSDVRARINADSIAEIMLVGPGKTIGYGVFEGISELPPATYGIYDTAGLRLTEYWKLQDREHTETIEQTIEHTRSLVKDAISRQMVSEVPIGTFLSGGLDSSVISAIAAGSLRDRGKTLQTFSVHYAGNDKHFIPGKFEPDSDDHYIDIMSRHLGSSHERIVIETPALVDALFEAVDARDLPGMADIDASLLLFCREVKKHVTVALSGECADELFGGYPWYRDESVRLTEGFPWAQSTNYRATFIRDEFLTRCNPVEYVRERYRRTIADTSKLPGISPLESRMKEMVNLNLNWFMQTLLTRKDQMSMYSGLEVRVPFCDYRIAEYLYSVPWEMKDYMGREKGLLRAACDGLLPEEILWRKKSPYPKTHHPEYLKAVSDLLEETVADSHAPILNILKKEQVIRLLRGNDQVQWYGQLMNRPQTIAYLLQINYWMKKWQIEII